MTNAEIAGSLTELADLLEIQGANPFRIRAYRNAIRTIQGLTRPLSAIVDDGEPLTDLPGVGKDMASHIGELLATGRLSLMDEVTAEVPRELARLTRLDGVGPKKARKLWKELDVVTLEELEQAAKSGSVAGLEGFGEKSAQKILRAIDALRRHQGRTRRRDAAAAIAPLLEHLASAPGVEELEVAGSFRRGSDTVGDVDILARVEGDAAARGAVVEHFTKGPGVAEIVGAGDTKGSIVLDSGLAVDLRVLPGESWGAALHYFTGSKEHNVEVRRRAQQQGLRVSEYGVFRVGDAEADATEDATEEASEGERIAGATESEVFEAVGLAWIPPVLRENRGEIQAAELNGAADLPDLVRPGDIRGDLHMHTTWSDGKNSVMEMAEGCRELGYAWFAITDHSQSLTVANGLTPARLRAQALEIAEAQAAFPEIRIFRGCEVDILKDGTLDLPDDMLEDLDLVLAAVHTHFELDQAAQTERVLKALAHPRVHALVHPTGRLLGRRDPYPIDVEAVLVAAREHDVAVELNANPRRLDLHDRHLFRARELGVEVVVNTDAHQVSQLEFMAPGLLQAQRGWLEAGHVVNTRETDALEAWLARKAR
ncbi:MAG: DNA polymerase/3'-5' exonuclease PolX [Gemmatimonadales bacterium]|nr:MAG: DNA polymerase/3'-5' exonuclease PolX [Gemmatimonadales bacterium]